MGDNRDFTTTTNTLPSRRWHGPVTNRLRLVGIGISSLVSGLILIAGGVASFTAVEAMNVPLMSGSLAVSGCAIGFGLLVIYLGVFALWQSI